MFIGSRVSKIRTGSIVTTDDGTLDAAFTKTIPPPPSVTATAAPIAAHRDLHSRRCVPTPKFVSISCPILCMRPTRVGPDKQCCVMTL